MIKGVEGKYTEKEIIEALKMIKDICYRQEECGICPFYNENYEGCNLSSLCEPCCWKFQEEDKVWRAFA